MTDLFEAETSRPEEYSAKDIEVLEGLEPVRRRPGMYIGGTDERALHHLAAEVLDNSMDEAVAGHASRIEITLAADGSLCIRDNGRGIPVDPHPKYKDKSALEVILTTLHSGGKFTAGAYQTSGGLHGVGISVVNALSSRLRVEVARGRHLWAQDYARGHATTPLQDLGAVANRRGTSITFLPDEEIFGEGCGFRADRLFTLARSKAFLYRGVEIRWKCAPEKLTKDVPEEAVLHFPGGLEDYLAQELDARPVIGGRIFAGEAAFPDKAGRVEWAIAWPEDGEGFANLYCNTVPTPLGGTHEQGLRNALVRGLRAFGELTGSKKAATITADDVFGGACVLLSVFIPNPEFQGQTKEKLTTASATRLVEAAIRDHFDHFLSGNMEPSKLLLERILERASERLRRREEKAVNRKTATRKLRLPGKLADCTRQGREGTELFIVEGDSAGGSAKQARNRNLQAVLPLRGKILNVASATAAKMTANQEISNLVQALGCGLREKYREEDLRYDKVIIMTDADVDGAHIASLLITFFFLEMRGLIRGGHLYLALPPLYRITYGNRTWYARDDAHKEEILRTELKGKTKIDIGRFKGLGEMLPRQLKETTMTPGKRTLLRIDVPPGEAENTEDLVERLMGRKPEYRFAYIQENARFVEEVDV